MSRIGKLPVVIPEKVSVTIENNKVSVKGPKGELEHQFSPELKIDIQDGQVVIDRPSEHRRHKSLHGLARSLLNNMVIGVSSGFSRSLQIEGVGYRAQMQGNDLVLNLGYSHPVVFEGNGHVSFSVDGTGRSVVVSGINKEIVGEISAKIRQARPPEPYKGKGIRYAGEQIIRKAGKAGAKK